MGTVVHSDGYIVTAAGDFGGDIHCQTATGQQLRARLVTRHDGDGFVLLKTDSGAPLAPVEWSASPLTIGTLVAVVQANSEPLAIGVVGSETRPIPANLLDGAELSPALQVRRIVTGSKAEMFGLHQGDIIDRLDSQAVGSLNDLRRRLGMHQPGTPLELSVQRESEGGRGPHKIMIPALGLARAFLHDAAIGSTLFGGPLIATTGKAIGINVGESHHISVCAVPPDIICKALLAATSSNNQETKK